MFNTKKTKRCNCPFALFDPFWQTKTLECGWFTNRGFGLTILIVLYYSEPGGGVLFFCLKPIWVFFKSTAEETKTILNLHKCQVCYQDEQVQRCVQENTCFCTLCLTSVADLMKYPHKKKSVCWVNKSTWMLNFGVAASRHTGLFPVLLSSPGSGCQVGCFGPGPAAPHDPGSGCCPVGLFH